MFVENESSVLPGSSVGTAVGWRGNPAGAGRGGPDLRMQEFLGSPGSSGVNILAGFGWVHSPGVSDHCHSSGLGNSCRS